MIKILLSPAKLMSLESEAKWAKRTTPQFLNQSEEIIDTMKTYSSADLEKLMKLSTNLAELNVDRYDKWTSKPSPKKCQNSALAFKGEVYRGLDAKTLSEDSINYLQQNLLILSGLYGILRPMDKIMEYRLEMGSKVSVNGSKNLYGFWNETLTNYVNKKTKKSDTILNLASTEYAKVLNRKALKSNIVDVEFKDYKNGVLKQIMVFFKQARGNMARFCAEQNIQNIEEVKTFNGMGYTFDAKLSNDEKYVFVR